MTNFLMFIATAIIAFYAWKSHELAKQIKDESEHERRKYQKLIKSIISSNMTSTDKDRLDVKYVIRRYQEIYDEVDKII